MGTSTYPIAVNNLKTFVTDVRRVKVENRSGILDERNGFCFACENETANTFVFCERKTFGKHDFGLMWRETRGETRPRRATIRASHTRSFVRYSTGRICCTCRFTCCWSSTARTSGSGWSCPGCCTCANGSTGSRWCAPNTARRTSVPVCCCRPKSPIWWSSGRRTSTSIPATTCSSTYRP